LNAQNEFAPLGAKWWYTTYCQDGLGSYCNLYTYEVIGDTIIDGIQAKIMEYARNKEVIPEATLIMYNDGDQVYHLIDSVFYLLYDFSAEVGDTIISRIDTKISYTSFNPPPESKLFRYTIDSVSTILIDNQVLKIQYPGVIVDDENGVYAGWSFPSFEDNPIIVEKMGFLGIGGMFGHENVFITAGVSGNLKCYQDDDIFYKIANRPCDSIGVQLVNNEDIYQEAQFKISPNPAKEIVYVRYQLPEKLNSALVNFYDIHGRLTLTKNITDNVGSIDWNVSELPEGICFYQLVSDDKILINGKLLISK